MSHDPAEPPPIVSPESQRILERNVWVSAQNSKIAVEAVLLLERWLRYIFFVLLGCLIMLVFIWLGQRPFP